MIEQLWYTWAARGLEGTNRLQIRAISDGLSGRSDPAVRAAMAVCYPPEGDRSFGWIERGGHRIVFNRVAAGTDGWGRPGNFVVHALIGDQVSLPASVFARLWGSSIWTTTVTDDDPLELPLLIDLDSVLTPAMAIDIEAKRRYIAHVVTNQRQFRRTAFALEETAAVSIAAAVAEVIPPSFGLLSFSSSESASKAPTFDLLASDQILSRFALVDDESEPTAYTDVAEQLSDRSVESVALISSVADRSRTIVEFIDRLQVFVQLQGGTVRDPKTILRLAGEDDHLLHSTLSALDLDPLAGVIVSGEEVATRFLKRTNGADGSLARLADAIAARLEPLSATAIVARLEAIKRLAPALAKLSARALVSRWTPDLGQRFAPGPRVRFLQLLVEQHGRVSNNLAVVITEDPNAADPIADAPGVATSHRVIAIRAHPVDVQDRTFAHLLSSDPSAVEVLLKEADPNVVDRLDRCLPRLAAAEALQLARLGRRGALRRSDRWMVEALRKLPPASRLSDVLAEAHRESRLDPGWVELIIDSVAEAVADRRARFASLLDEKWQVERVLPKARPPELADRWLKLLRGLDAVGSRQTVESVTAVSRSASELSRRQSDAVYDLLLERINESARSASHWAQLVACVAPKQDPSTLRIRRIATIALGARAASPVRAWAVESFAVWLHQGLVTHSELNQAVVDRLRLNVAPADADALLDFGKQLSKPARRWLEADVSRNRR